MSGRIYVEDVTPVVAAGRYPAKAVVGEHVPVTAAVWREGHDAAGATVVWRGPDDRVARHTRLALVDPGADRWSAAIAPDSPGPWTFRVDAWSDPWATWEHAVRAKLEAGQGPDELANDLATGVALLHRAAQLKRPREERDTLLDAAAALADESLPLGRRAKPALSAATTQALWERPVRDLVTKGETHHLWVDRERALFGSWYEFFPRSTGGRDADGNPVHGTLTTAADALDRIKDMGFDVVYLPPVHPIGEVNRKGRNNSLTAQPGDVGSPWAIGSKHGGHDAIHPDLGTLVDFKAFVERAHDLGLEVAMDLALQCAPDHPWVAEHPEWFTTRPDGTIAYAENPPKKYQDIYPLNFDNDPEGLRTEILRVVQHWIDYGVRTFRVDNPHTKPPDFWHWLIWQVKRRHPDVLFLAEAFTRPARLYGLARLGFDQSYTYFTWRDTKAELTDFGREIAAHAHEARPNLFVTTPDILPTSLQLGLPAMSALRAALAATLAPTWGVYSGFELHEHQPLKGEEFLNSEKYELRPRDFDRARAEGRSLEPWLTKLNAIRRAHPALRQLRELTFHDVDNDALIAYSKTDPATGDTVVCVITLDPHTPQEGTLRLDPAELGLPDRFPAHDEVTGQTWRWGRENYVRLDPATAVAHIVDVGRPARRPSEGA
ncbi:maltotransferase domain-containing protein [Saccharothrix sp.]|uniref:maltotransferase domain-containing protein n=1 Tax=Saccharothrix sp. TaxID=1873460 RepID=UPI0028126C1D|nr:maltotransferase domain-containing protein [Saccharothrix sp.]